MVIRRINIKRAEDILNTINPKYKWFYFYDKKQNKLYFYSETKFLLYELDLRNILNPEQRINVISHFISLLEELKAKKLENINSF